MRHRHLLTAVMATGLATCLCPNAYAGDNFLDPLVLRSNVKDALYASAEASAAAYQEAALQGSYARFYPSAAQSAQYWQIAGYYQTGVTNVLVAMLDVVESSDLSDPIVHEYVVYLADLAEAYSGVAEQYAWYGFTTSRVAPGYNAIELLVHARDKIELLVVIINGAGPQPEPPGNPLDRSRYVN